MKKTMILLVLTTCISMVSLGQTWQDTWRNMTAEEKMMQLSSYRKENQKFLKDSLGMTSTQLHSIDSVNSVYMKELQKIENGSGSDEEKYAKARSVADSRRKALDAIMGEEKHMKFTQYVYAKLQKEHS